MKKIISMILAVVMLACVSTTAFAFDGASGSDVVTHVYSHYNITIPATINVTTDSASNVTISNAYIEDGYKVEVKPMSPFNGNLTLRHTSKTDTTISATIYNREIDRVIEADEPIVTFSQSELTNGGELTKQFDIFVDTQTAVPGDYEGILNYSFGAVAE